MKKRILGLLLAVVMLLTVLPQITTEAKAHRIVMTAEEFIDCLWTAYNRPNYYYNAYPYNLGYYDGSRITFDCWNLGKAIIWTKGEIVNNYTVGAYAAMDASCGLGDWDGYAIIKAAPNCSGDFTNLVPGEWLYMDNHTGYYVGNGQVIECTAGWGVYAITVSQIDQYGNRSRNGVPNGSWKLHGMVPWLDYSGGWDHWESDSTGWWYEYADGSYAKGWAKIDSNWYYFDQSGYMHTGWLYDENYQAWYYFDPISGAMQTGWIYPDGYYYYLDTDGKMLTGWKKIVNDWFYLNTTNKWPAGAMLTGFHEIDGEWYYFNDLSDGTKGAMKTGWVNVNGSWYYFNANGVMQRGWQFIDGQWYHLNEETGIMSTNVWLYKDGVWYYVNASGVMTQGAQWNGVFENGVDIGTGFYATIDIPLTGTRVGVDSDPNSETYQNVEVQAVRAEDADNYNEQLWYFERRAEDGSYRITNAATQMVMDQIGSYVDMGTNVRVCPSYDSLAQRWFVFANGDQYGFVSACSAWNMTVLDVADGLGDEGTNIRIWSNNGTGAQIFAVTKLSEPAINIAGASLSFEDEVLVNLYATTEGMQKVGGEDMGLLIWTAQPEEGTIENAEQIIEGAVYDETNGRYMVQTPGIPAKKLGDDLYMRFYGKLADGSYVYSKMVTYSPKKYAMSRLQKSTDEKQKALCVAMLNYGAAAQSYFGYKTDKLMNAELTAAQQALVIDYSVDLFVGRVSAPASKIGSFAATDVGFGKKSATVSFDSAFAINYYFTPNGAISGDMTMYYWSPEDYAATSVLTADNATGAATMVAVGDGSYWANVTGIAAKALDKTYYVAAVYTDAQGNRYCSGVVAYSLSRYCMNNAKAGNPMEQLAAATAMYGYYAERYFN